ncbi:hypothetical protein ACHAXR_010074 [Thalassiosira sp. AJA248-18]
MAAKKNKAKIKKSKQKPQTNSQDQNGDNQTNATTTTTAKAVRGEDLIYVCPSRVRFQHSRIRPFFSGCGRSVVETLEEIREGRLDPGALPPIQVIIGPDENDGLGPWYFSLNNRRLWVLKQCHREGILDNISVRVRTPKSGAEAERYSIENCALEAKFMREGGGGGGGGGSKSKKKGKGENGAVQRDGSCDSEKGLEVGDGNTSKQSLNEQVRKGTIRNEDENDIDSDRHSDASDSESDSDDDVAHQNPFSALL